MRIEVYYEAPSEVIDLNEEEAELWTQFIETKEAASDALSTTGWSAATELYTKADRLFEEFYDLVEGKFSYQDLDVEDIVEW